jgi:hypothetical protein
MPDDDDPQRRFRELPALAPAERRSFPAPVPAVREAVEPALTWRHVFSLPAPAVVEAVRELAADYRLRERSHADILRWEVRDHDRAASVIVSVRSLDGRTEIVVRLHPHDRPGAIDSVARQLTSASPFGSWWRSSCSRLTSSRGCTRSR